jgi:5-hydroxyisourate hydrolase-like protein (transthyretin family)
VNPDEGDRAPIAAADYELCDAREATSCTRDTQAEAGISRLPLTVPGPGEWELSVWRTDAAGNESEDHHSVPVTLRYDPEPPRLAFESPDPADPTLAAARAADELSGVAGGGIDIAPAGTTTWQSLPTANDDGRLVARIDDATLPPGAYILRAHASDQAGNQTTQDRRSDGQPMVVTLPLRKPASILAGFERTVRRPERRRGNTVVLRPAARVGYEQRVPIAGRLATTDGRPIAGAAVQLFAADQVVDTVTTDANGRFRTVVIALQSQDLRLAYAGSPQALPTEMTLRLRVSAATSARVSRSRVRNGQAVTFRGRVRGLPVPAAGKLVEIQVRFTDRWQTFRTTRSDALGRWSSRYRFQRTRGVQRYRFRIRLPKEAGYPFETSVSRTLVVQVSST